MRILIQRVKSAKVTVDQEVTGEIGPGLLVFLGVHKEDQANYTEWLVRKLVHMRIFSDEDDKMNLSVKDINGSVLVVSQFTLYGNCSNGRRPDFVESAGPELARPLYEKFVQELSQEISNVQTGRFAAKMTVDLINDGPVTLMLER